MFDQTLYTSDPHFGHARIIDLCGRPFKSVDEMNWKLVANFNRAAPHGTRLFILGDAALGSLDDSLKCIAALEAHTILLPGNHDRMTRAVYKDWAKVEKREKWYARYREVFDEVWEEPETGPSIWQHPDLTYSDDYPVWMSHYPSSGDSHGEDRVRELRPKAEQYPLIHGHVHNMWQKRGAMFNVGVDVNDFTPVTDEAIDEWLSELV